MAAIALASVVPMSAHAEVLNGICEKNVKMTDGPAISVSPTSLATYPAAGYASGTAGKGVSNWFQGVFHDIILVSQSPLSLRLYDYNKGAGCTNPKELCRQDGTGLSAPARCQMPTDSQRYFVEVRNTGDAAADYELISVYHCYVKNSDATCKS